MPGPDQADGRTLDLTAYLERTGATAHPPSLPALTDLLLSHARTFPFDNIDVLLDQHPGVELAAVQDKFVGRRRGGYCFEHATLFHAVLQELGYDVQLRLGRVGDPAVAARTHLVVVATLDGQRHLLDPGVGIPALAPIPMVDGAVLDGGLWPHRLTRVDEGLAGPGWRLARLRRDGWEHMHSTDELPVRPVDVLMGHHWTSTSPASYFRSSLILARHGLDGTGYPIQTSVSLDGVTDRRWGEPSRHRALDLEELPVLLDQVGAGLSAAETGRLTDRLRGLIDTQS